MSELNSIAGLNKVNVDYRPEVETTGKAVKQQAPNEIVAAGAQPKQSSAGTARSVVQQLDVLLLNAAKKSVAADAERKVADNRDAIVAAGISNEEVAEIEALARTAPVRSSRSSMRPMKRLM